MWFGWILFASKVSFDNYRVIIVISVNVRGIVLHCSSLIDVNVHDCISFTTFTGTYILRYRKCRENVQLICRTCTC